MKNFIRTISFMIVTVLILSAVLPVSIYASSVITGGEGDSTVVGAKTGAEDITIRVVNTEPLKGSTGDESLNAQGYPIGKYIVNIPVEIDAYNSSYIKDAAISFENSNFNVVNSEIANDKNIQSIQDNVIKLNSSEVDEKISLNVPVSFKRADYVAEDYFNKNVNVKLSGIYVDKNGNEKNFEKQTQVMVSWDVLEKEIVSEAEVVRCFTFTEDSQNNVMVTLKFTSGVLDSRAPEKEKTLEVNVPTIRNIYPQIVISADNYTIAENQQNGKVVLTKNIEKNEKNEYKWENENDVTYITYIYKNVGADFYSDKKVVTLKTNLVTVDSTMGEIVKQSEEKQIPFNQNQEKSEVIIAKATSTQSINRGYIISNVGMETVFDVKYTLNIGYAKMTNSISLKENQNEYSAAYRTKKISVSKTELTRILGDNGKITISLKGSADTYEITKNNLEVMIPNDKEIDKIVTSKPTDIGNLNISMVKSVNSDAQRLLANKNELVGTATITNIDLANNQSETICQWITKIEEPTQKVHFESRFKTLSTIKKNERIALSVVLESDSVDDYLYKEPSLRITYPEVIKEISNVTINVLYNDNNELIAAEPTINNANHTLVLQLNGTQTHYTSSAVSKGILIQIVADYALDRLAPTKDSTIKLELHNVNTNQTTVLEKGFKIVAPTKFIIQNKMEVTSPTNDTGSDGKYYFKETRTTIEEDVEDIIMPLYSDAKYIDVFGTIVNNQGADVENVVITGNFPSKDSNSYSGTHFDATFDTAVIGGINVDAENEKTSDNAAGTYEVFYSRNANESIGSNNWSRSRLEDAKSYKIVFLNTFKDTERKDFHYRVRTPEDMSYSQHAKESFALLYGNGSVLGEQSSYLEAKPIGVATKQEADFSVDIKVNDYATKQEIKDGDSVREGAYLNVKVSITNVSNRNIKNVKAILELKENIHKVEFSETAVGHYPMEETIEETIDEIKASETKVINKTVYVDVIRTINGDDDTIEKYSAMNVLVYEGNELEFKPKEFRNRIENKTLSAITVCSAEKSDVGIDDVFQQYFYVRNLTANDMSNVEIKGKLPEGIEYDSEQNEKIQVDGLTYSYNPENREYTIKIANIEAYYMTSRITLNLKAINYGTYELKAKAQVNNEEAEFNTIKITVAGKARNFEVSHTISTQSNIIKDTDIFYFNIIIKNHWDSEKLLLFNDRLDDKFIVKEYTILQNDKVKSQHKNTNSIEYNFTMAPEDVAEIRIKCGLKSQPEGTTINLTHEPKASCKNINVVINPITINVIGTGKYVKSNNPVIDGKYNISGTAWLDANNNGRREETEQKISNIRMELIDNNTKQVVVDDSGNEKITTTNDKGEYIFTDIPIGSYVVVAYYNSDKYGCGDYKNRNVAEDLNNDFLEIEYNGQTVGATTNIIIQNTSVSAIDISLIPRNTFDMALEKNVTNVYVLASNGKEANYKYNNEIAKVEISNEKNVKYYFTIEYTLTIKNVGYIDGYAKSLIDYIPKGMTFAQEDNPGWYIKSDGYAYNDTIANTLIKAQNKIDVKIKLRKEMTAEQTGMIKNSAELGETYNVEGIEDINSKGANKDSSENDYSEALVVVALSTGGEIIKVAGIVFGVLAFGVVVISIAKHKEKKKII